MSFVLAEVTFGIREMLLNNFEECTEGKLRVFRSLYNADHGSKQLLFYSLRSTFPWHFLNYIIPFFTNIVYTKYSGIIKRQKASL